MQFQVPQFIDIEDKLFGPLTFKQFLYLAGGGGLAFLFWKIIPIRIIGGVLAVFCVGFGATLAFYKVNGRPFIHALYNALAYTMRGKMYLWQKPDNKKKKQQEILPTELPEQARLTESKLKDLAWSLDVLDQDQR